MMSMGMAQLIRYAPFADSASIAEIVRNLVAD